MLAFYKLKKKKFYFSLHFYFIFLSFNILIFYCDSFILNEKFNHITLSSTYLIPIFKNNKFIKILNRNLILVFYEFIDNLNYFFNHYIYFFSIDGFFLNIQYINCIFYSFFLYNSNFSFFIYIFYFLYIFFLIYFINIIFLCFIFI
jgi:hypothetical protein